MQGRGSGAVRAFALFGETTGETDEFGLPVRYEWAARVPGPGPGGLRPHARARPEWLNNTIDIDTGCVFGGRLTALRYPERELVACPLRSLRAGPAAELQPFAASQLNSPDGRRAARAS
ncbi:MAG: hypothetical protein WKG07_20560 [Hymenobacter sp.]